MESQAPRVTVEGFDGPLDLLLELVEEKKLDILTVRLGDLADAYLARVRAMAALPPTRSRRSRARVAARAPESAKPAAEPRAASRRRGESEEELRSGFSSTRSFRACSQLGARLRAGGARLSSRGRHGRASTAGRRGRCAGVGVSRVLALATRSARGARRAGERYSVEQRTAEIEALVAAQERVTSLRPRRRANDRLRGRHVHRAARSLPARCHRPGTGRALRRHRHHEEGSHIRSDLANAIEAVLFVARSP